MMFASLLQASPESRIPLFGGLRAPKAPPGPGAVADAAVGMLQRARPAATPPSAPTPAPAVRPVDLPCRQRAPPPGRRQTTAPEHPNAEVPVALEVSAFKP